MATFKTIEEAIGNTPLIELTRIEEKYALESRIFGKLESANPGGSIKDRVALSMLDEAERKGLIKTGSTIIEPTSGNTGIGLAMLCASRGYHLIIVMPESMSCERRQLISAYGAKLILTPKEEGMSGSVKKAEILAKTIPNSFIPAQFDNPANPLAHFEHTGPEIDHDLAGKVDAIVSAFGTGGTIMGLSRYFKDKNRAIRIIGVEPASSPLLSKGHAGPHKIQGIGANFVPSILKRDAIDEIIAISDEDAYAYARLAAKEEGTLIGISSGAALYAGIQIAKRKEMRDKNIVVIFPDSGERYLSSGLFDTEEEK